MSLDPIHMSTLWKNIKDAAHDAKVREMSAESESERPHMYWCPRGYCGWTGSRRPTGGACPECLLGNDERVMVIEG